MVRSGIDEGILRAPSNPDPAMARTPANPDPKMVVDPIERQHAQRPVTNNGRQNQKERM